MIGLRSWRGLLTLHIHGVAELGCAGMPGFRNFAAAAASNNMALIKQLREQTGAPIADVKSALQQADWNIEKASEELRKKGLAAASKKASRHAAEGLVGLASSSTSSSTTTTAAAAAAAIVEINSETDFVARNDQFKQLVSRAAAAVLNIQPSASATTYPHSNDQHEIEHTALQSATTIDSDPLSLADAVADVAGTVRENIKLRRGYRLAVPPGSNGVIGSYIHAGVAPGLGRIASMVLLQHPEAAEKSTAADVADAPDYEKLQEFAHKLAMHVVGAVPLFLSKGSVPPSALDKETAVLTDQASRSGKPQNIIEKMVQGRISKYYEEVCLLEQLFILDDKKKVKEAVTAAGEAAGVADLQLSAFVRVQVGEGLEESKKDFAAEVAETLAASEN